MKHDRILVLSAAVVVSHAAAMYGRAGDFSAGGYHTLRIDSGAVLGLGDGTYGQLGTAPRGVPATVAGLGDVTDVAAGGFSTLALKSDGTVWFLGEVSLQHTTPHGTPNPVSTPVQVAGLSGINAIAVGHRHFLALDTDTGNLFAWGHNGSGQVGDGGVLDVRTPVIVLTGVTAMSAGDGFSLAVRTDHTVWSWGRNHHGQLGLGDAIDRLVPTQVSGVATAEAVAAGGQHALILLTDGSVLATGDNHFGQLGLGTSTSTSRPAAVVGLSAVTAISAGYFHSAAFGPGNQVSVWGRNFEGQCGGGSGSAVSDNSPHLLTGLPGTPVAVACGYHFTLVELVDGSVAGTGSNSDGQLDGVSAADQDDGRKLLSPRILPLSPAPYPVIENHSFEADENTDGAGAFASGDLGSFGGELTGWIHQSGASTAVAVGWKDISAAALDPYPPVAGRESQALSLQSGAGVLNTTSTPWSRVSVGQRLTLTISLGMRDYGALNWCENTFFGLTDGDADFSTVEMADTVASSRIITDNPATGTQSGDGTFADVSFSYIVQAGDPVRTGNIGILIYAAGTGGNGPENQSFFDNVRLALSTLLIGPIEFVQDDQAGFELWPSAFAGTRSSADFATDPGETSGTTTVSITASTTFGISANRGSTDGTPPGYRYQHLYEDLLIATTPQGVLTIDVSGLNAGHIYRFTLFSWDPGAVVTDDKVWTVTRGKAVPASAAVNYSDALIDNETFAMVFDITADGSGAFQLTNTGGLEQSAVNGFILEASPPVDRGTTILLR